MKHTSSNESFSVLQYKAESISNGVLALLGFFLVNEAIFMLLILIGIVEFFFGYQRTPVNLLTQQLRAPLALDRFQFGVNVPSIAVLNINSVVMALLAAICTVLAFYSSELLWIPANLISLFAIMVGITGICPVAITYAWLKRRHMKQNR